MYLTVSRPLPARSSGALGRLRGLGCGSCRSRRFAGLGQTTDYWAQLANMQSSVAAGGEPVSSDVALPINTSIYSGVPSLDSITPGQAALVPPSGPVDQNPLDYVSPQAAIAAGLNPATVNAAWSKSLNTNFGTPQAAIAAGVPAGVVTQLWSGGTQSSTSWLDQTTLGIKNSLLLGGAAAIAVLAIMRRR